MKHLIFLGGFPSGGTDLLKNILNAHSEVFINGEMPFLYKIPSYFTFSLEEVYTSFQIEQILEWLTENDVWHNLENKFNKQDFITESVKDGVDKYNFFYQLFSDNERKVWGNKTPQNTENAEKLLKLFPESKLLIVTRDVRDVVLSWKKKWGKNPFLVADKWNRRMSNACELAIRDDRILIIKFEDLLSETEKITKEICQFIEIEWEERMLYYHLYVENVVDGKINYGKPIKSDNKKKWKTKVSGKFIKRIEEIAYNGLVNLNYEIEYAKKEVPLHKVYKKYGMLHDVIAMLLVGNRVKGNNSISDRLSEVYKQIILRLN